MIFKILQEIITSLRVYFVQKNPYSFFFYFLFFFFLGGGGGGQDFSLLTYFNFCCTFSDKLRLHVGFCKGSILPTIRFLGTTCEIPLSETRNHTLPFLIW